MDYLWECKNKHQWTAKYYNILGGKGCPECLKVPYEYFVDLLPFSNEMSSKDTCRISGKC